MRIQMKTLKQFLKEVYQYKENQWTDDDVTDIVRTVGKWLMQKRGEKYYERTRKEIALLEELFGELEK